MKNIILLLLLSITMISCNSNESEIIEKNSRVQISNDKSQNEVRQSGQIPLSLNFHSQLNDVKGNNFAHVNLLKQIKKDHGSQDYYNNLFELSSFELFKSTTIYELGVDEIKFLLNEMISLESNMVNIENIPVILNLSLSKNIVSKDEFLNTSKNIIEKNKKEINQMKWRNLEIKAEKLEQISQIENQLYYARSKY